MSVSARILSLIFLPLLAIIGLSGWLLVERWTTAAQMQRLIAGGDVIGAVADLVGELQTERGRSALFLGSKGARFGDELNAARQGTDGKAKAFRALMQREASAQLGTEVVTGLQKVGTALDAVGGVRTTVSNQTVGGPAATQSYSELIEQLLAVSNVIIRGADQSEVKNMALALGFLQASTERAGLQRATGAAGLAAGSFTVEQLYRLSALVAEQREYAKLFAAFAPAEAQAALTAKMASPEARQFEEFRRTALAAKPGEAVAIEPAKWFGAATAVIDMSKQVEQEVLKSVVARARDFHDFEWKGFYATAGGALVLLTFMIGFGGLTMRSIVRPVKAMTAAMTRLATGELDCEVPTFTRKDEIGAMAAAVQVFKDNALRMRQLEIEQREAEERAVAQRKADMHRMADGFEAAVGNIIDTVGSAATELEAAAGTLTDSARQTQDLSNVVASASEEASVNVQSVASASDQLAASVNEISRQVQESSRIAVEAVQQAERTDVRITELSHAAGRIGDVVKMITAIAEQTNLLALNATIEAARAGDAGRGFAVVAQEVKALAAQTAKATDEIGSQITSMQSATQESVTAIKEIGTTIDRIAEIASAIAAAVEEQGAATGEIASNVQRAAEGTTRVAANIGDVSRGANETGSASSQVLASAQSLAKEGNMLKTEVDRFLQTVRAA